MQIKITPHYGNIFAGAYWLEKIETYPEGGKRIVAHFTPVECVTPWNDCCDAADWLCNNRIDCDRVDLESEGRTYTARSTIYV